MLTKKTSSIVNYSLLVISVGLTLAVSEFFLRSYYPTPYLGYKYIEPYVKFFQYDPVLGWKGRANAADVFARDDFYVFVTHDKNGYRNKTSEYDSKKDNILVLGDSYAWGWGVEDDEVFSTRIDNSNSNVNVYNLSAPGYGTDQEFLTLKRFLEKNPEHKYSGVVLLFYRNDFRDNILNARYSFPKPQFVLRNNDLVLENVPVPEIKNDEYDKKERHLKRSERILLQDIHLYNLVTHTFRRSVEKLTARWSKSNEADGGESGNPAVDAAQEANNYHAVTLALMSKIADMAKSRGMFFHVVMLKVKVRGMSDAEHRDNERLEAGLRAAGIQTSSFESRMFPSELLWLDGHLSAQGHKRLSSHVTNVIRENSDRK